MAAPVGAEPKIDVILEVGGVIGRRIGQSTVLVVERKTVVDGRVAAERQVGNDQTTRPAPVSVEAEELVPALCGKGVVVGIPAAPLAEEERIARSVGDIAQLDGPLIAPGL